MHISEMESTTVPSGQSLSEIHARAELAGRQSNYMTLPEIVKSSKNFPLGPDCMITRDSEPDETVLVNMDLYWLISLERGCVELKVLVCEAHSGPKAITHDPRVIVTRKPRRFEAYCCAVCRQNFVTVVQALLHMKAFHRQSKKILIQDQNVFHNIDKAMEVPRILLPWYVAKQVNEQNIQVGPSTAGVAPASGGGQNVPSVNTTSSVAELNPVTMLLQAIGKEYGKSIHTVLFGKGLSNVQIQFDNKSSIVAHLPDLANAELDGKTELNSNAKLEFHVRRVKGENGQEDSCVVRANNPALAQKLIDMALKQGVAHGSGTDLAGQDCSMNKDGEKFMKLDAVADDRISDVHDSTSPTTSAMEKDVASQPEVAKRTPPPSDDQNSKENEGVQGVVNQLISPTSKTVTSTVEPESPVLSAASSCPAPGTKEELIATASLHVKYMPKNRSVPNLPSIGMPVSVCLPSQPVIPSLNAGMVRVQSWGGRGASNPLHRSSLSAYPYTPSTSQSFDNMTRDELCKSFLAVGRSFTYAEKIKLMNKLNDEDALITQEHVKGAGKLLEAEATRQEKSRVAPSPSTLVIQQTFEKPHSPNVSSAISKAKHLEAKTDHSKVRNQQYTGADPKKRRRSKYDVDRIIIPESEGSSKHGNERSFTPAMEDGRCSYEGSLFDKDDDGDGEDKDDNPPTLLDVLRTNLVKTGFLTPSGGQSTSPHIPTSYPSMLSDSEYYGSGEWANAAMQTLRNFQTKVYISPPEKPEQPEYKNSTEDDSDSLSTSPFVDINSGFSSGVDVITTPFVPKTPSTKTDTSAVDAIMALAQQMSADQAHMTHSLKYEDLPEVRSQRKRSLSPLLTEGEKELIRSRANTDSTDRSNKKAKRETKGWQWHGVKSEMNSNNRKKVSASSNRRTSESTSKSSFVIAEKGDVLEFMESLTGTLLDESNEVTMRFCKGTSVYASNGALMDMSQLCTNSIETLMKVRYVEKIIRCRVCGFSVVLNDDSNGSAMKSHVMEHSLKELLHAEYNVKQLI